MSIVYNDGVDLLKDYYLGILSSRVRYFEITEDNSKEAKLIEFYLDTLEWFLCDLKERDESLYRILELRYRDQLSWDRIVIQVHCCESTMFRRRNRELNRLHKSLNFPKRYSLK